MTGAHERDGATLARLRDALQAIKDNYGQVCGEYEVCMHPACESSYGAWATADAALAESAAEEGDEVGRVLWRCPKCGDEESVGSGLPADYRPLCARCLVRIGDEVYERHYMERVDDRALAEDGDAQRELAWRRFEAITQESRRRAKNAFPLSMHDELRYQVGFSEGAGWGWEQGEARHAEMVAQARVEERSAVVAWLRKMRTEEGANRNLFVIADAIENGAADRLAKQK